jgi:acyl-CoA dehydrogenase
LRVFIFPRGRTYSAPADDLAHKVVELMTRSGEARERLSHEAYTTLEPGNPLGQLQEALELSEKLAPMERRLRQALKEGLIRSDYLGTQIEEAEHAGVIARNEAEELREYHDKVTAILAVDDFASEELRRTGSVETAVPPSAVVAPKNKAKKKAASKKKKRKKTSKKSQLAN